MGGACVRLWMFGLGDLNDSTMRFLFSKRLRGCDVEATQETEKLTEGAVSHQDPKINKNASDSNFWSKITFDYQNATVESLCCLLLIN